MESFFNWMSIVMQTTNSSGGESESQAELGANYDGNETEYPSIRGTRRCFTSCCVSRLSKLVKPILAQLVKFM